MLTVALIAAGGGSRRMGVDKLLLPWRQGEAESVLERVIAVALAVADAATVLRPPADAGLPADATSAVDAPLFALSWADVWERLLRRYGERVRIAYDHELTQGPLWPIAAAWPSVTACRWVFLLAGDLPGIVPDVLRALLLAAQDGTVDGVADGALAVRDGRWQPLVACYRQAAGAAFRATARAGEHRLQSVIAQLQLTTVPAGGVSWPPWWTRPVHTPADWQAWQALQTAQTR